jgi:hypothetical protein
VQFLANQSVEVEDSQKKKDKKKKDKNEQQDAEGPSATPIRRHAKFSDKLLTTHMEGVNTLAEKWKCVVRLSQFAPWISEMVLCFCATAPSPIIFRCATTHATTHDIRATQGTHSFFIPFYAQMFALFALVLFDPTYSLQLRREDFPRQQVHGYSQTKR